MTCIDAFRITSQGWFGQSWNYARVRENAYDGTLTVAWDITQSIMEIIRPQMTVNGKLTLRPSATKIGYRYEADQFPSQELYYFYKSRRQVVLRRPRPDYNGMGRQEGVKTGSLYKGILVAS